MPRVKIKDNESFEYALRRFKRSCEKAGIIAEMRRRQAYEKPTAMRKRKAQVAVKKERKRVWREMRRLNRVR